MGILSRVTARQRLRRATDESLTVPTFSAPLDCTPWVIGGLWPIELSANRPETATLAQYLKADLHRIAATANEDLRAIGQAGMAYSARRAAEARVIDEARALAISRVESTLRQVRHANTRTSTGNSRQPSRGPSVAPGPDLAKTEILPVVRDEPPGVDMEKTQLLSRVRDQAPASEVDTTVVLPAVREDLPLVEPALAAAPDPVPAQPVEHADPSTDGDQRLQHLLAFVARQEPRLHWAVGECEDGTTMLATDLAHGWIPPGIALPDGVRLLEPDSRAGSAMELLGPTVRDASYAPGDSSTLSAQPQGMPSSTQPLELPAVADLGWELGVATHWRDGLPSLANSVAKAAAAQTEIAEQELDLLRVHLDTARYQMLAQYPDVDPALLLNCMLLATTVASITGDMTSANYHFAWFQKLEDRAPRGPAQPVI